MILSRQLNLFRALSDKTRLEIVRVLLRGERCVLEITGILKLSQPKISRHLAYLKKKNLVRCRKDGSWQYYRLNSASLFNQQIFSLLNKDALPLRSKDANRCQSNPGS